MKLSEALTKYIAFGKFQNKESTMTTYETAIKNMVLYLRNCELEDVKLDDILSMLGTMQELGWDRNSLSSKCCAFKQFFSFYYKQGYKMFDPDLIPIPEIEHKFPKIIDDTDYNKLLKVCQNRTLKDIRDTLILRFLYDTGVRMGEILNIRVEDVDTKEMRCMIQTEKTRGVKPLRMVFWTKETNKVMIEYLKLRAPVIKEKKGVDSGYLFVTAWGKWGYGNKMSTNALHNVLRVLSERANLGYNANPHRFRHHFGRSLAMQNANNSVISDMMGHSDINSTRIYTVMNEKHMSDAYDKFFRAKR